MSEGENDLLARQTKDILEKQDERKKRGKRKVQDSKKREKERKEGERRKTKGLEVLRKRKELDQV